MIYVFLIAGTVLLGWLKFSFYPYKAFTVAVVPLRAKYKEVIKKYFPYYQMLPKPRKVRFEQKVQYFIDSKKFISRSNLQVSTEMKALIAASAVQLTFGLPNIFLSHFSKVLIYPEDYYSKISRVYHKGEVNPRMGAIVLSWQSFIDGYLELKDGVNLGLHEMGHALKFENLIANNEFDFLSKPGLAKVTEISQQEMSKLRNGDDHFFRAYGGKNEEEFFAVAVENFFERPKEFKNQLPELYQALVQVLNQDPSKLADDFKDRIKTKEE